MGLDLEKLLERSWKSGRSGASAMAINVTTFMWMRTIMNYQYSHGGTITGVARTLYRQGGVRRFYRGYSLALIQGPVSRFGDTFSNTLALATLEDTTLSTTTKTVAASITAGLFRILLLPIDTIKTFLQVHGEGRALHEKTRKGGIQSLFHGAVASSTATMAGHYPWFATYNYLDATLSDYRDDRLKQLARNGVIGFSASVVSDTCSNSLRVLKTARQTAVDTRSYREMATEILKKDNVSGLFTRGLPVRVVANGIQGMCFTVLWKYFQG